MLAKLESKLEEIAALQSRLILLFGLPSTGKSSLLCDLAGKRGMSVVKVGALLGARLAAISQKQRHLQAGPLLRDLSNEYARGDVLLLDNIELLFDSTLKLNPLEILKRHAHARRVVAAWPGEFSDGRLTYAALGHPEHQDYGTAGWVPFELD